jgi:lipoprotein-anchoring transpeptidase ErfK/SrfK
LPRHGGLIPHLPSINHAKAIRSLPIPILGILALGGGAEVATLRRVCLAAIAAGFLLTAPAAAREVVGYSSAAPGTVVVHTRERSLYLVLGNGAAIRYSVAVGRPGKQWHGEKRIEAKVLRPIWGVPKEVRRDQPWLPAEVPPGPKNPLGAAALALGPGGEYAIHGTNDPASIGRFASYGCIRMQNADILDLFQRVSVGTRVVVRP